MAIDQMTCRDRDFRNLLEEGSLTGFTDGQLLGRLRASCPERSGRAFAALVERHGPMVLRTCRGILRNDHDAQDAFQATFLVLMRKSRTLHIGDSLGPWLHRVASRTCYRARAQARRRSEIEGDVARLRDPVVAGGGDIELLGMIHREIDGLPERMRAAVVLCDLEGETLEQAARKLGCPVGTVGSRLSRGRQQLRLRLIRRGVTPAVAAALAAATLPEAWADSIPNGLATSTVAMAQEAAASVSLLTRAVAMTRFVNTTVLTRSAAAAALAVGLIAAGGLRADSRAQAPTAEPGRPPRAATADAGPEEFGNEPDRRKDFLMAEIGNLLPVVKTERGSSYTIREAVLYRDGSAKLWPFDGHEPVCPPLRHGDPIRELSFFDRSGLLVTTSARTVKLWDGATGALRKELPEQFMRPLFLLQSKSGAPRFATVDLAGSAVTVWDAGKLEPVARIELKENQKAIGAGVSPDGATLATVGEDHRVTLWQVDTKKEFASLCPPSGLLGSVFVDKEVRTIPRPVLQFLDTFWGQVRGLAPSSEDGKDAQKSDAPGGTGRP